MSAPASKWELPARNKPGRKANVEKTQSKTTQRAFRERRQYVQELEAKVKAAALQDGERALVYQQTAQKFKDENDQLKMLVVMLRNQLAAAVAQGFQVGTEDASDGKRGLADDAQPAVAAKRPRLGRGNSSSAASASTPSASGSASPPTQIQTQPLPAPRLPANRLVTQQPQQSYLTEQSEVVEPRRTGTSCGICKTTAECLFADTDECLLQEAPVQVQPLPSPSMISSASVPILRRRSAVKTPIWKLTPATALPVLTESGCNGNPATCPACADDPRGQEFCSALSSSVSASISAPCPCPAESTCKNGPEVSLLASRETSDERTSFDPPEKQTNCGQIWSQLKQHPNIGSANLQLLAEVVARKSHSDEEAKGGHEFDVGSSRPRMLMVQERGISEALSLLDREFGKAR